MNLSSPRTGQEDPPYVPPAERHSAGNSVSGNQDHFLETLLLHAHHPAPPDKTGRHAYNNHAHTAVLSHYGQVLRQPFRQRKKARSDQGDFLILWQCDPALQENEAAMPTDTLNFVH